MTKSSLDLSGKIDALTAELYEAIDKITSELEIQYLVVGATARDLVLHYGFGARIKRATTDIDFGVQLESWGEYEKLKKKLIENNFEATKLEHRFKSFHGTQVDIVPFGNLENDASDIHWPPKGDVQMSVLGFKEAFENAIMVKIQDKPHLQIPVASPHGLALLKLISWGGREIKIRDRDAKDFAYLLDTYEQVSGVVDRLYDNAELMDKFDWDIKKTSAFMLGVDSAAIAQRKTWERIKMILDNNMRSYGVNHLIEEMCSNIENEYNNKLSLLQAFAEGFEAR